MLLEFLDLLGAELLDFLLFGFDLLEQFVVLLGHLLELNNSWGTSLLSWLF